MQNLNTLSGLWFWAELFESDMIENMKMGFLTTRPN